MSSDEFVGYVGHPDFHDGTVMYVGSTSDGVVVDIDGASGQKFIVEFCGVTDMRSNHAEVMMLYGLVEMRTPRGTKRFVFANWDEESNAYLEVEAEGISVRKV